uniref:Uncharacterized protein n=1 Tax=Chromera velia CCMP2878 TaxID=1169474 RepID=A0A0G4HBL0_9ALVE|mmetsp:Transcript_32993/g.65343  ORF Transcript_32993/g.65343 Transcript_32993/m.65343 type:complete len:177 (-) Transcript_32993:24-554(-)|eukprot:Cvel_25884.t1-p1 / transcript=Cvel_25884.t1 / gene=Cvel_25884 / organism=Chromera_velia_CCMP2878 / gene_product=hypothetical protein / transcript_product=hypothetical protein / location=Cvel_scaffold2989:15471-15998(+) / protein_length=176 / sequence_SO=supercontig / SO=protein_coding / is_pseudo=false
MRLSIPIAGFFEKHPTIVFPNPRKVSDFTAAVRGGPDYKLKQQQSVHNNAHAPASNSAETPSPEPSLQQMFAEYIPSGVDTANERFLQECVRTLYDQQQKVRDLKKNQNPRNAYRLERFEKNALTLKAYLDETLVLGASPPIPEGRESLFVLIQDNAAAREVAGEDSTSISSGSAE